MAYADAVKAGVRIDPDRRAHHMFIWSGPTDDKINHICGFVHDPEAVGQSASLDPRKIQEAALRFYERLWHGAIFTTSDGHAATTAHGHQTSYHPRSRAGSNGSCTQETWGEENNPAEHGHEYNDWEDSSSTWQQYPAEEPDDWEEEADLETHLAGKSDWIHRDLLDSDTLDSYVEEECSADQNLYEAYSAYKEARNTLNQVLPRDCASCHRRRGAAMTHFVEAKEKTVKARPTRARVKETKV